MEFKLGAKPAVGDIVSLKTLHDLEVVACQETGVPMVNIDADQLESGDLKYLKSLGLTISNPSTDKPVALGVDFIDNSWGHKIKEYLSDDNDNDDDSHFFSSGSGTGTFLGGMSSTGFGGLGSGGFGGFGGGGFGGGGASRGF